jgi:hypothetical protein
VISGTPHVMAVAVVAISFLSGFSSHGGTTKTMEFEIGNGMRARLGVPVVVCTSDVGERRWGHHQFVSISEYPGNRILLRHHAAEDAVKAYGTPNPTYISSDAGKTWESFSEEGLPPSGLTCPASDGHFICLPMAKPLDTKAANLTMPQPVASAGWRSFRVDECPEPVQRFMREYEGARWDPQVGRWQPEQVLFDTSGALVRCPGKDGEPCLLSRTAFERAPLRVGKELILADYRLNYVQEDGAVPGNWGITCMVSQDNGKTWNRRATIALDKQGTDNLTEPMLAENVNGELVCVIRRSHAGAKSMMITYSGDKGKTWEKPVTLDQLGKFGVFPALVQLECGVMVLSYGRPGVHLAFSPDGTGRDWSKPFTLIEGDAKAALKHTDGYTTLLPLGKNKLLMAYTDFEHHDPEGQQRKAIVVRELTIEGGREEARETR